MDELFAAIWHGFLHLIAWLKRIILNPLTEFFLEIGMENLFSKMPTWLVRLLLILFGILFIWIFYRLVK